MTAPRPGDGPRPFSPDELDGVAGLRPDELAAEARIARDLEAIAARGGGAPGPDFTDRVMAAIAAEPVPAPLIAAGSALRRGAAVGFLASLRDSFRVAFGGGFPAAVRAQALVFVLLVVGVTAGAGYATAGALGLLGDRGAPSPSVVDPSPTPLPSPSPAPTDSPSPTFESPSPSESPSASPEPTASPDETEEPDETNEPAEGDDGGGSGVATASPTPKPTRRPTPEPTPEETEEPDHTHTPKPSETPHPTETPDHDETPSPSPTPDSGD